MTGGAVVAAPRGFIAPPGSGHLFVAREHKRRRGLRRMPCGAVANVRSKRRPRGHALAGRFLRDPRPRPPYIIPALPRRARVRQARRSSCRGPEGRRGRYAGGRLPDCQAAPIHACRVGLRLGVRAGLARESGGPSGKGKGEGGISLKLRVRRTAWASFNSDTPSARLWPSLIRTSSSSNTLATWGWG